MGTVKPPVEFHLLTAGDLSECPNHLVHHKLIIIIRVFLSDTTAIVFIPM